MSKKYTKDEKEFIRECVQSKETLSWEAITDLFNDKFNSDRTVKALRRHTEKNKEYFGRLLNNIDALPVDTQIERDRVINQINLKKKVTDKKYSALLNKIEEVETERDAMFVLGRNLDTTKITAKQPSTQSEATAFMVASDWHVAETVNPNTVNGLNSFTLDDARTRSETFFKSGHRLIKIFQKDTKIDTLVLPLLGDFMSGNIHDELIENNSLSPIDEAIFAQNLLATGIEFLLKDKSLKKIILPCHSGNHGRITKERRISTEKGNNLEYLIYHQLANHFRDEKRIQFNVSEGYHSYLNVYDYTVRFHHGHALRYGGGIGGITIPVNKAIAQWDKIKRADLDVFGHFHTFLVGEKFISNGSIIGYGPFALSIKADYAPPKQAFFLIDKKRFKTVVCPILF